MSDSRGRRRAMQGYDFPGQDAEYRQRRAELLVEERALRNEIRRVAALRRQLPVGRQMPEYLFREGPPDLRRDDPADLTAVRLADLFGPHDTLIVDHLMFGAGGHLTAFDTGDDEPCPMCSMWAD